ncbi:unnamed protein product [Paramecium pentaurelia]|uniref:Transmembrane protein n=1 Tax=Paramecium pentaurelia TaxID=43138 RepID=A0A8S1TI95_9CILI|nr:unnamed protein product [Paramecium pentaurelia]
MIIFVFIFIIRTCEVLNEDYYLYPTKGEILEIPMEKLFQGNNLIYQCSQCPQDVRIVNAMNHKQSIENDYIFTYVTSFQDQIFTLTTEPSLNIYLKLNGSLTLKKVIKIDSNLLCLSVTYRGINNIILDCYQNETLIFYSLKNEMLIQIYTSSSSIPNNTKLSSIINNKSLYFIYGQFYSTLNQIIMNLTIFYEQQNYLISTYNQQELAYNFVVSQRESTNQTIFIQLLNEIKTYVLSQQGTLLYVTNILLNQKIFNMAYYYSEVEYYQFDQIFLIILDDDQDYMYLIVIFYSDSVQIQLLESQQFVKIIDQNAQLFISQQFIIIEDHHKIIIMNNKRFNQIIIRSFNLNQSNSVVYFDQQTQKLYIFGKYIEIYTLLVPTLIFGSNQNNGSFSIHALDINDKFIIRKCQTMIHYLQVPKLDNNVYFIFQQPQQSYFNLLQYPFIYWINFVSGPLVKVLTLVSNPSLGNFNDSTLRKLNQSLQSDQNYYMVKAFSVNLFQECQSLELSCFFIVAINNQNLDLYYIGQNLPISSTEISNFNSSVIQIEITFVVLDQQLYFLVCLSFSQNIIQLYQYNGQLQLVNNTTLQTNSFRQFQLLSNALVLLLDTNQIAIMTFDNQFKILLDSKILNQTLGQKIDFDPISIYINQQYQSRILYINNQNSFIIGQITEEFKFVLISFKTVIFPIENLQVVNNLLILSYIHQESKDVQFEVWDVKKWKKPQFLRYMRSLIFELNKDTISYYSDNQFFYVQIGLIVNVFNPTLSEHSSLYYRINIDGIYFTSTSTDSMTLLYFNQSFFQFSSVLLQTFFNSSIHSDFLSEQIFNFTICSQLYEKNKIYFQNNSVTIINNYQQIQINKTKFDVNQSQSYIELFRNNISIQGQVLQFNMNKKSKNQNNYTLTNYINYFKQTNSSIIFDLIIQYNDTTFLLMNNSSILNYTNGNKYYFGPYKKCISSTAYNFQIYSLCQDNQSKNYIISMNLSNKINNSYLESKIILTLANLSYSNNSWIRIKNNQLYIWNNTIFMYSINQDQQKNGSQDFGQFICKSTQFGFQSIQIQENDGTQIIIYFYFKPIHKDQLYYRFAKVGQNQTFNRSDEKSFLFKTYTQQYLSFNTIPMVYQKKKEIIIMVSNSNFILAISFLMVINKSNFIDSHLIFQSFLQTSPPFDKHNFNITQLPQYEQGLLLFMYSQSINLSNQTYMITFYNISNKQNVNYLTPLFFQGGYNFTLNNTFLSAFSFIARNNSFGQMLLLFTNGSILELQLNIFSINITLSAQRENLDYYELYAQNYFNSAEAEINLVFIKQHIFKTTSFYVLFGITLIVLVISLLLYNVYSKRNQDSQDDEDNYEL